MKEITEEFSSFNVSLKNIGAFPASKRAKILWVGIEEGMDKLIELFSTIENKVSPLGFEKEKRNFTPHITFARVKKGNYSLPDQTEFSFDSFPVNEVVLFKSTLTPKGPIYETVSLIPLGGNF